MEKINAFINSFADWYNALTGLAVAILTAVFGTYYYVFVAYFVLNVLDWLTGWKKSKKLHKESSAVGLIGIIKKLGYWVIIAVAFLVSSVFVSMGRDILHVDLSFLIGVGWFTVASLLVNEVRSILENLVEIGYDIPKVFINGLEVADKLINKDADEDKEQEQGQRYTESEVK